MDGVNSVGRHDDCQIRIRSSQVSRRHCEIFEQDEQLMLRDLGSSNGTYVNGRRVLGQQSLKAGDVITIGGVTLRVDTVGAASPAAGSAGAKPAPHDTAELDAIPVAEEDLEPDDEEFEIAIDDEPDQIDLIPLDDEAPPSAPTKTTKTPPAPAAASEKPASKPAAKPAEVSEPAAKPLSSADEEDAVAQFLMDLKLDEED
jgi:pSer/pThr/pTyr-binding forkhead associated (FHA) protein